MLYIWQNKFGELGCNVHWQIFNLVNRAINECKIFIIHVIISSVGIY